MSKNTKIILIILLVGILYRLAFTANGNFLFNMDNARDMVDVREMVVLHKIRLIGPTSAIEGLFNGPFWYYLLAIPFVISGGNPYASILMEIVLWAIGGFFLLKLVSKWGEWLVWPIGILWIASNYVVLTNYYAFNPNPVTLLAPLFIYLLVEYLDQRKAIFGILTWILAGLFFNFEMNFGIFTPIVIVASIIFTSNAKLFKQKWFWIGAATFILFLLPQIIFDLKHQFVMSEAVFRYLSKNSGISLNIVKHIQSIQQSFYNTFQAILMNNQLLTLIILLLLIPVIYRFIKEKKKETVIIVSILLIFIPFFSYLILPITVNSWHLGGEMIALLVLLAYLLKKLIDGGLKSKILSVFLSVSIIWLGISDMSGFLFNDLGKINLDTALYKNEIAVIDYVYKYANGKNFKVYTFMPSVYDYPYQYLFWWYGKNKYGYIPGEYAYAPDKPQYIPSQDKFQGKKINFSGLVFLIKEPNRGYDWKSGWEASYMFMELVSSKKLGSVEIEVRREIKK